MPIRCWPTFTEVPAPPPPPAAGTAATPQTHIGRHVGYGRYHRRHIWGLGAHKPAAKLVLAYAGLACIVTPLAIAGLAGPHPWSAGGVPTAPGAVVIGGPGGVIAGSPGGGTPVFVGVPPGIIGERPVTSVPEPSSLWDFAPWAALVVFSYWSGLGTTWAIFRRRKNAKGR